MSGGGIVTLTNEVGVVRTNRLSVRLDITRPGTNLVICEAGCSRFTNIVIVEKVDNDPNSEGTWRAAAVISRESVMLLTESIRDWIATPTNAAYGGGGGIDPDTTGATGRQTRRQEILNHETAHLLGLSGNHWEGEPTPAGSVYGDVMRPSTIRQSSEFGLMSLHIIRGKQKPGTGP